MLNCLFASLPSPTESPWHPLSQIETVTGQPCSVGIPTHICQHALLLVMSGKLSQKLTISFLVKSSCGCRLVLNVDVTEYGNMCSKNQLLMHI